MYTQDIYTEAIVGMILLFVIPFLIVSLKNQMYIHFSLSSLVAVLNKVLIVYAVMCVLSVVLIAASGYLSDNYTAYYQFLQKGGNVLSASAYFFVIAVVAFFFPALLLLRLINYLTKKKPDTFPFK